jgi:hypothetical protein
MAKVFVYTKANGSLGFVYPNPRSRRPEETEAAWLNRVLARDMPAEAVDVTLRDDSEVPQSKRFRDCWRLVNGQVRPDLSLARMQVIREARAERTRRLKEAEADEAWAVTDEERAALATYRQAVQDMAARVRSDTQGLGLAALATYRPAWPQHPLYPEGGA